MSRLPVPGPPGSHPPLSAEAFLEQQSAALVGPAGDPLRRILAQQVGPRETDRAVGIALSCATAEGRILALAELALLPERGAAMAALEQQEASLSDASAPVLAALSWSFEQAGAERRAARFRSAAERLAPRSVGLVRAHLAAERPIEAARTMPPLEASLPPGFAAWFGAMLLDQAEPDALLSWLRGGSDERRAEVVAQLQPAALAAGVDIALQHIALVSGSRARLCPPVVRWCLEWGESEALIQLVEDALAAAGDSAPRRLEAVPWLAMVDRFDGEPGPERAARWLDGLRPEWVEQPPSWHRERPYLAWALTRAHIALGRPVEGCAEWLCHHRVGVVGEVVREQAGLRDDPAWRFAWAGLLDSLAADRSVPLHQTSLRCAALLLRRHDLVGGAHDGLERMLDASRRSLGGLDATQRHRGLAVQSAQELAAGACEQAFLTARRHGKGHAREEALRLVAVAYAECDDLAGAARTLDHLQHSDERARGALEVARVVARAHQLAPALR